MRLAEVFEEPVPQARPQRLLDALRARAARAPGPARASARAIRTPDRSFPRAGPPSTARRSARPGRRGSPRTFSATMLRWTSEVPRRPSGPVRRGSPGPGAVHARGRLPPAPVRARCRHERGRAPARSRPSSITRWPWASASALRTEASGPGGRPASDGRDASAVAGPQRSALGPHRTRRVAQHRVGRTPGGPHQLDQVVGGRALPHSAPFARQRDPLVPSVTLASSQPPSTARPGGRRACAPRRRTPR